MVATLIATAGVSGPEASPAAGAHESTRGDAPMTVGNILFATDSDSLEHGARVSLDRLAAYLERHWETTVSIEGYTDSTGPAGHNADLSIRRADSAKSYLVALGVNEFRLLSVGRGSTLPVASNESATGRQQNRRVQFVIRNDLALVRDSATGREQRASVTSWPDRLGPPAVTDGRVRADDQSLFSPPHNTRSKALQAVLGSVR